MQEGKDPSDELVSSDFENSDISFTANLDDLRDVEFFIVAVPTPIDDHNKPDLRNKDMLDALIVASMIYFHQNNFKGSF